jgi:protoheme IX farnesyltransferase
VWTPPHFWSLALYRAHEYARAGIPMLPVTHGRKFTRHCILSYTVILAAVTVMPFATGMSGLPYLIGAMALNAGFIGYAWKLCRNDSDALARKTFRYSIRYLAALFDLLIVDHSRAAIRDALQAAFS